jgi:hypothetical protein
VKVRATMSVSEEAMAYEDARVESLITWVRASNLGLDFPFVGALSWSYPSIACRYLIHV